MTDEQVVRAWFVKLLADFRIYSPLYKVTVSKYEDGAVYMVKGDVNGRSIHVYTVAVNADATVNHSMPMMIYKGTDRE